VVVAKNAFTTIRAHTGPPRDIHATGLMIADLSKVSGPPAENSRFRETLRGDFFDRYYVRGAPGNYGVQCLYGRIAHRHW
jgi:hypothetical protein